MSISRNPEHVTGPASEAGPHHGQRHVLSEIGRLLSQPGCPVCRHCAEAQRTFFSWFQIESSTTVEVQERLRAGLGMCPVHSRRLVDETGGGPIMTRVMRQALAGAREAQDGREPGPCPACESAALAQERTVQLVLEGLREPATVALYSAHGGMCAPHVSSAVAAAEPPALEVICAQLRASLARPVTDGIEPIAGIDPDARLRKRWRDRLPSEPAGESTAGGLEARLGLDTCPVCLSRSIAGDRYLHWLADGTRSDDAALARTHGELCATHLHDVAQIDLQAGRELARRKRTSTIARLTRLLEQLPELSPPSPRRGRRTEDPLTRPRQEFALKPHCPACHAGAAVEQSQLELTTAALALGPVRVRYQRSHGLCVKHGARLREGDADGLVKRHLTARLGVLAWEVEETARKYAWAARHEPPGPEQDAWLRGLVQIDGLVFEGGPAPVNEIPTSTQLT